MYSNIFDNLSPDHYLERESQSDSNGRSFYVNNMAAVLCKMLLGLSGASLTSQCSEKFLIANIHYFLLPLLLTGIKYFRVPVHYLLISTYHHFKILIVVCCARCAHIRK